MSSDPYPRETVEFLAVPVTVNGTLVTSNVTFAVVRKGTRPAITFEDAITLEGKIGIMIEGMVPGVWQVYAKVHSNPEIPVIDCGSFTVD